MKTLWFLSDPGTDLGSAYTSKQKALDSAMLKVKKTGKPLYVLEVTAHCSVKPVTVPEIRPIQEGKPNAFNKKNVMNLETDPPKVSVSFGAQVKEPPSYCPECLEELAKKEYREGDEWITIHSCPRCLYEEMGVE